MTAIVDNPNAVPVDCGYMLRPRYRPGWVPSWKGTKKDKLELEDDVRAESAVIIDARRIRDGMDVCLKTIELDTHGLEHGIGMFFCSDVLANDPRNHCVPILERLQVPDDANNIIIVMPLLREYSQPRFDTFGEAVDFFSQIFEGVKFMHDHNVAHRDCKGTNIMMDGSKMFPDGFHPMSPKLKRDFYSGRARFYTRTQRPPKYYLIDFGLSRRYETRNPPPLEPPIRGGDKSVPEFRFNKDGDPPEPCHDPFPTDIYYLGKMNLTDFICLRSYGHRTLDYENRMPGFEFMKSLADDMVAEDPAQRPTIDEVVDRFTEI
ncbi:kinase-like domain-containing protein [Mycena vulgaris]|nr:kinase-like domain-containing protein [Mycena vulgaris]